MARQKSKTPISKHNHELKSRINHEQNWLDRLALWFSIIFGSALFTFMFIVSVLVYILWNLSIIPGLKPFDLYPFDGLNTVLAIFAVFLATSVLMAQNRQRRQEKVRDELEFEVNVRAENEITKMLEMLHEIQHKLGIDKKDEELEQMKETLDLDELHKNIGEQDRVLKEK